MIKITINIALLLICIATISNANEFNLRDFKYDASTVYSIKLTNGDLITGLITEIFDDGEGYSLRIKTELGNAVIFDNQIYDIYIKSREYKHAHRVFLMPTAEPIGKDYFIGSYELVLFMAGFGISDIFSFTAARSFIPTIASRYQISNFNAKFTLYKLAFTEVAKSVSIALGGNYMLINHNNQLLHIYNSTSVDFGRTMLTANIFYKAGNKEFHDIYFDTYYVDMYYPNGAFGLGLGLDTKFPRRNDIHFIGELWNIDVMNPTKSALMLGLRICNTSISADFGFSFFTQPFIAPFASFVWTPF